MQPEQPARVPATLPYAADFERLERQANGAVPAFVKALRREGIARFQALGFPSRHDEAWRSTDLGPIVGQSFAPAAGPPAGLSEAILAPYAYPGCARLVFVDGHWVPALSDTAGLPEGLLLGSLAEVLRTRPERVEPELGRLASRETQAFVALNTAFLSDGAFLRVPAGMVVETPIQVICLASGRGPAEDGRAIAAYPRHLIQVGARAQVTLIETYASPPGTEGLTVPVTELRLDEGAFVDHYRELKESLAAYHVASLTVYQERASNFDSHAVLTGGALVRSDLRAVLAGEGAHCTLNGLYVVTGRQHVDNQMLVEHVAANCTSFELYKGILDGQASAVFNGRIHVHPGAQKTDAVQKNQNLLLSGEALAHSNPQLEIFADDVRCTHGSTVGQLDEEAVFYLRSRGIGAEAARSLLTYAFAADIVDRIKPAAVRRDLEEFLFERLPRGEVVRQAI